MKKVCRLVFFVIIISVFYNVSASDVSHGQLEQDVVEKPAAIIHYDSAESIVKRKNNDTYTSIISADSQGKAVEQQNRILTGVSYKNDKNVAIVCYKNGISLVRDTRNVKVQSGINEIEFDSLYPGLIPESVGFRTPKKGKITVLNHVFNGKKLSRQNFLYNSIDEDVFFCLWGNGQPEKGKLIGVSEEDGKKFAIIVANSKCYVVPAANCIAFGETSLDKIDNNSLNVVFEAEEQENLSLEISYLMTGIFWKHFYLIEVFEKLDRVDLFSQAVLCNNTNFDLENVSVTFDISSPDISESDASAVGARLGDNIRNIGNYRRNITVKRQSETICVLKAAKSLKPTLEYMIKIPLKLMNNSLPKAIELPVHNLLTIANAKIPEIDMGFNNSTALIFRRKNNEKIFLGRQVLSSLKQEGNLVFEIGNASDITAVTQQIDYRKLSDKSAEYSIRVTIKNNKMLDVQVVIAIDVNGSWNIIKKNFEMQKSDKPMWKLNLKAGESKESHFRIKVDK